MATKVSIKSQTITPFGGIFYVLDEFSRLGLGSLVDKTLGVRPGATSYRYSEIFRTLFGVFLCGGDCIEDVTEHVGRYLGLQPGSRIPSADTMLRGLKELSCENITYKSGSGGKYDFNTCDRLNGLLLDMLTLTGQLRRGELYDYDFDHQVIPTEKRDTKYTYKKTRGYFPGVATIGGLIVHVENRDGNTNVRFKQAETLKRSFKALNDRGIGIDRCRMDCGSFSEEIVSAVHGHCRKFYIRAAHCRRQTERVSEIKEWAKIDLNGESCGVASMPFDSFLPENGYRLVVQRRAVGENLFGTVYVYRCILTNDHDSSEKEVIEYYNARGAQERVFDRMNNDFGWKRLPFSSLKQNTVFLLVMAMLSNFYLLLVSGLSKKLDFVKPTDRLKRFVFRFVSVPAKWVRTARQWKLILYTDKPYMNALGT